ncbi:MAG: FG-GAP-like repeat-containing protein [Terriglobia bacterium]
MHKTSSSGNKNKLRIVRIIVGATALLAVTALALAVGKWRASAEAAARTLPVAAGVNAGAPNSGAPLMAGEIQSLRGLGKAYYEQGKYTEAVDAFKKVVAAGHAAALDHLDLAQGLIQTNQLNQALEELTTAEQMAPGNLAIHYNLGILYKHELRYPDAERELQLVIARDPNDPPTWFNLGDVYFAEHKMEPAFGAFRHVVVMGYAKTQNFYVAATFHCFIILNRLKNPTEAKKYLAMNMATRNKVPNVSLQYPALEAGKYGEVNIAPPGSVGQAAAQAPKELVFQNVTSMLPAHYVPGPRPFGVTATPIPGFLASSIAVGDYNGDGLPDIYFADGRTGDGVNHLLRNNGNGTFTDVTKQAGVEGPGGSVAAEFVDYNNSGHPSLVVVGVGGVTLYKNNGNGTFTDVTKKAGIESNPCELDTDVKAVDLDNDGFLDLVVTAYADLCKGPSGVPFAVPNSFPTMVSHLYRNNGDGTFTDITASAGLESARGHMRQVVFADFNNDGYMDLVFVRDGGHPLLFLNQGDDKFTDGTQEAGVDLADSRADEAAVSDFNHDGKFDLALFGPWGYSILLNRGDARFEKMAGLPVIQPPYFAMNTQLGTVADLDGNGFDDLLVKDQHGMWRALLNQGNGFKEVPLKFSPHWPVPGVIGGLPNGAYEGSLKPTWLSHPGDLDLLSILPGGGDQLIAFQRQGPTPHWIQVKLEGYKSNKQGIGDIIELKNGNFYDKVLATKGSVRVFTGSLPKLDVVRVTWPNQVVQNSVDVATDTSISVKESERLASSCPFLYVWNGKRFVFFTDILGAAPIGELAPDGTYLRPNPQELVRLGGGLKARNGDYVFQLTDEMREVDYFDQLRLLAVDHPGNEDVYSNEIYSPTPVAPALFLVRNRRFPVSAVDDHGRNVLPLIRHADGRYPTGFRRNRILGLAAPHSLTLDLGAFPQASRVALWLKGWVFWTDSNASRALMANHHLTMTDPYLQVRDKAGKWVTVIPDMGLPSGTNRTMRVDLTGKFLTPDHHIRIATNLCVYWDQIFFTTDESQTNPSFALPLVLANLHYRGFSAVKTDPNHLRPDYFDYARLMTHAPWNPARGPYTRYGRVRPLLVSGNNQLVAMSTGDEMTVTFSAVGLPPVKTGWKRDFFLYARGYAKDGEPNTAFARSVNPLPFDSMGGYPPPTGSRRPTGAAYRRYLKAYQTRPGFELIPPLAPPSGF